MKLITYRLDRHTIFNKNTKLRNGYCLCAFLDADLEIIENSYKQLLEIATKIKENDQVYMNEFFSLFLNHSELINSFIYGLIPYDAFTEDSIAIKTNELKNSEINKEDLMEVINHYISVCEGILRVKYFYKEYIDSYHFRYGLPVIIGDSVRPYTEYLNDHNQKVNSSFPSYYFDLQSLVTQKCHVILDYIDENGISERRIQERLDYSHIGDFLYAEFSDVLRGRLTIKKCQYCGRHFIIYSKYATDYCDNIAPGETIKKCREIASQRKFENKVKNNPILLAYQRAYKTHYARVSKGIMSKKEFFEWSKKASNLRDEALEGNLDFYVYTEKLNSINESNNK